MGLFHKNDLQAALLRRKNATDAPRSYVTRKGFLYVLILLIFTILIIETCFVGLSPAGPQVVKGQYARTRIIAEMPFSYKSEIETERARTEIRQQTPPVYRLDQAPCESFRKWVLMVNDSLTKYLASPAGGTAASEGPQKGILRVTPEEMNALLRTMPGGNKYNLNGEDVAALANTLGGKERTAALNEALRILSDIYRQGVYDESQSPVRVSGSLSFMKIADDGSGIQDANVLSEEQAVSDLKINIGAMDISRETFVALFRIMRSGLAPNLIFDARRTNEIVEEALKRTPPKVVSVAPGETIIEPGMRVSDLQFEQLQAYRKALRQNDDNLFVDTQLFDRALIAIATIVAFAMAIKMQKRNGQTSARDVVMACLASLASLAILRLLISISEGSLAQTMPAFAQALPWAAPLAIGPILIAILLGSVPGAMTACFIAIMSALMQGGSIAIGVVTFLSCLAGVYVCRDVQVRTRVVRAGFISGLLMTAFALAMAVRNGPTTTMSLVWQTCATLVNGFITGVVAVGLIPLFEHLFRRTTDITLLELTDFNHPLLRRMQVAAPGSYHHSLMVANLAENAALKVGANSLACRTAALYHDIGKIIKPEYFTENQREGNPHSECSPSMSALIIKAHVKEGVVLARQHGLPKIVVDVIQQHHGTTLIQYFYYKALQRQQDTNASIENAEGEGGIELDEVAQSTYRYDGPKPQCLESAIVMLADTIEAASRSLKKVTPQSIEDFVEHIVQGRVEDGQLDEAPITLRQLALIKESFNFTLLNMLHSRIEYPKGEPGKKQTKVSVAPMEIPLTEAERLAIQSAIKPDNEGSAAVNPPKPAKNDSDAKTA
jgi:putative nucleotidyltransferase with HDIG domain